MVQLTKSRHEALLAAEIVHFAHALEPQPITLEQILAHTDAETLREFLLEELPIRYARRIHMIETLPAWDTNSQLRLIRSLYVDAFRRLRTETQTNEDSFRSTLVSIKRRNAQMLTHVVKGTRQMKQRWDEGSLDTSKFCNGFLSDQRIDEFLDEFLTARIGTDILSSQYLSITNPDGPTSVIDRQLNPVDLVRAAGADAMGICKLHYGFSAPVDVVDVGNIRFPFVPQYLNYIMFELLKNSLRAVVERYTSRRAARKHPVRVVVCGDDATVVIRVSDSGGGIPGDSVDKVWSYLYTTAKPVGEQEENRSGYSSSDDDDMPPMAGFGCGLPLSRTYAAYVGGRLELNSMPDYGTDAYLYLDRVGNVLEVVESAPRGGLHL